MMKAKEDWIRRYLSGVIRKIKPVIEMITWKKARNIRDTARHEQSFTD
jgi:hypothetical protein